MKISTGRGIQPAAACREKRTYEEHGGTPGGMAGVDAAKAVFQCQKTGGLGGRRCGGYAGCVKWAFSARYEYRIQINFF